MIFPQKIRDPFMEKRKVPTNCWLDIRPPRTKTAVCGRANTDGRANNSSEPSFFSNFTSFFNSAELKKQIKKFRKKISARLADKRFSKIPTNGLSLKRRAHNFRNFLNFSLASDGQTLFKSDTAVDSLRNQICSRS